MKILVMACDKNEDLFPLFHHCMEKYWPDHPEIIYSTETKINPYYKTICKNYPTTQWSIRLRETLKDFSEDIILLMVDDIFVRAKVDNSFVLNLANYFDKDTLNFNLEQSFDLSDTPIDNNVKLRNINGRFRTNNMCTYYNRLKLITISSSDNQNPWQFEHNKTSDKCLVMNNRHAFQWGRPDALYDMNHTKYPWTPTWGLINGKWTYECLDFFKKEGIIIDSSKRGISPYEKK